MPSVSSLGNMDVLGSDSIRLFGTLWQCGTDRQPQPKILRLLQ